MLTAALLLVVTFLAQPLLVRSAPAYSQSVPAPSISKITPTGGPTYGGTSVVITGSNFEDVVSVTFGTAAAYHYEVDSAQRITATSPPHDGGMVQVVVATTTGWSSPGAVARFMYFEPTGRWISGADMVEPRAAHTATLISDDSCENNPAPSYCGTVLVAGGEGDAGKVLSSSETYDPASDRWKSAGALITARSRHVAILLDNGKILVTGGVDAVGNELASVELYDPASRSWAQVEPMSVGRRGHTATLLANDDVLVAGGVNSSGVLRSAEIYDPDSGRWYSTGSLQEARRGHTATVLHTGVVLVAGGTNSTGALESAELFDVRDDGWSATASLLSARHSHTATHLPSGKVLVSGGAAASGPLGSSEVFDAGSPSWSAAGSLATPRSRHSATPLADGSVLVVSGVDGEGTPSAWGELFNATSHRWTTTASLMSPRRDHVSTLLPGGDVLITGGCQSWPGCSPTVSTTELFELGGTRLPEVTDFSPPAASTLGGTQVTVRGAGFFFPATTVRFGEATASSIQVISDSELVAVAPAHPQSRVGVTVGTPAGSVSTKRGFIYAAGTWRGDAPLTACRAPSCVARHHHTATLIDGAECHDGQPPPHCGKVLLAGGSASSLIPDQPGLATAVLYDPATGTWTATGSMTVARYDHTATLLNGPGCRAGSSAIRSYCGKVLVVGGQSDGVATATSELYDPVSGRWHSLGVLNAPRYSHSATLLDSADCDGQTSLSEHCGKVLVVGGSVTEGSRGEALASAELYDPVSNTWTLTGPLAESRVNHTATLLPKEKVLVSGGIGVGQQPGLDEPQFDPHVRSSNEIYEPTLRSWTSTGALAVARFSHSAALLSGPDCARFCGKVVVAGGVTHTGETERLFIGSTEIFDTARRAWEAGNNLPSPSFGHTSTLLRDRRLLLTGGGSDFPAPGNLPQPEAAWLFDPTTGDWSSTTWMSSGRGGHTATSLDGPQCRNAAVPPLYCDAVLVAGGLGHGDQSLGSAEIYMSAPEITAVTPATGSTQGGTEVRLRGNGFIGLEQFFFGDVPASSFEVVSPSEVVAAAPSHLPGVVTVSAVNAGGTSATMPPLKSHRFTFDDGVAGARVVDLAARVLSHREIRLSFSPPTTVDGTQVTSRYLIKQSTEPITEENFDSARSLCGGVCSFDFGEAGEMLSLDVKDLKPSATYHYALKALGDAGERGPMSNVASATTLADTIAPAAVDDVVAKATSHREVELRFSAVPSDGPKGPAVSDYVVVQSRSPITGRAAFSAARRLCRGTCSFSPEKVGERLSLKVTDLSPEKTYHYAIRAKDEAGNLGALHDAGSTDKAKTLPDDVAPGKVTNIEADALSNRSIQLVFDAVASDGRKGPIVTRYRIVQSPRAIDSNRDFKKATRLCGRFCSFAAEDVGERLKLTITELRPGTTYHYALRALDEGGNRGPRSKSVRARTLG